MNLNSSPSHFPMHQSDHELYHHHSFLPNRAPSVSCHFFFDPTQHHTGFYDHHQLYHPNHVLDDDHDYGGSTYDEIENKVDSSGLKLGLWRKEDVVDDDVNELHQNKHSPMKWMSSEMRVMHKMKHTDHDRATLKITSSADQKVQPSSSPAEADLSSHSSTYNSPIRVCSDCSTTTTPLWRSGPKGPKSLCNACGIRQRKARRAMAAAAATAATNGATSDQSAVKNKLHKGKLGKNGHPSQLKKRCKTAVDAAATTAGSPSTGQKQLGFEDFLISLSKKLAFHHVFPDDEKDAAILLMALSSGLVNG